MQMSYVVNVLQRIAKLSADEREENQVLLKLKSGGIALSFSYTDLYVKKNLINEAHCWNHNTPPRVQEANPSALHPMRTICCNW